MRAQATRRRLSRAVASFVSLAVVTVSVEVLTGAVTAPAEAATVAWAGTVTTTWQVTYTFDPETPDSYTYEGSAALSNLAPLASSSSQYSADVTLAGTYDEDIDTGEFTCHNHHIAQLNGHTEATEPALEIAESDGQVWMTPHNLPAESTYAGSCTNGHETSGTDHLFVGGFLPTVIFAAPLTADTDPAPGRLVGRLSWALPNLPGGHDPGPNVVSYTYTLTYDLTRVTSDSSCSDGLDNDGDGSADFPADPGCDTDQDDDELGTTQCDNGLDDDLDSEVDFRASGGDPDCTSLRDDTEAGDCAPAGTDTMRFRTITDLPVVPDVHWYTTTVVAEVCEMENGDRYITDLDVDRHVEGGPVPLAIGLVGWISKTETDVGYAPDFDTDDVGPVAGATAAFNYTACFDLTKLLDKLKFKKLLKRKMKKPLRKNIKTVLENHGMNHITRRARKDVGEKFKDSVDHALKKGTITTWLRDNYKVPERIGGMIEDLAGTQRANAKHLMKSKVGPAINSGKYDGLTADAASELLVNNAFKQLGNLTASCGASPVFDDHHFETWNSMAFVNGGTPEISMGLSDSYVHPLMTVRQD